MAMITQQAAALAYKGLQLGAMPASDKEYAELVRLYLSDPQMREAVHDIVDGMQLRIIGDVSLDRGFFLAPMNVESRFAFRLSDIRSGMDETQKALLALCHLAIAATFFPTMDALENAQGSAFYPIKFTMVRDRLHALGKEFAKAEKEGESLPETWRSGWALLDSLPLRSADERRAAMSSVVGMLKLAFSNLIEGRCIRLHGNGTDEANLEYIALNRYRAQLMDFALPELFVLAQQAQKTVGAAAHV